MDPDQTPPPPLPPMSHRLRLATLILRAVTLASLVEAIAVLATMSTTAEISGIKYNIRFKDFYSYGYLSLTCAVGMGYTLVQTGFVLYYFITGYSLACVKLDFYGDKVVCYLLATGVGAGFLGTTDMKEAFYGTISDNFFNKGYLSSALALLGSVFTAFLSILSFYALQKKVVN